MQPGAQPSNDLVSVLSRAMEIKQQAMQITNEAAQLHDGALELKTDTVEKSSDPAQRQKLELDKVIEAGLERVEWTGNSILSSSNWLLYRYIDESLKLQLSRVTVDDGSQARTQARRERTQKNRELNERRKAAMDAMTSELAAIQKGARKQAEAMAAAKAARADEARKRMEAKAQAKEEEEEKRRAASARKVNEDSSAFALHALQWFLSVNELLVFPGSNSNPLTDLLAPGPEAKATLHANGGRRREVPGDGGSSEAAQV